MILKILAGILLVVVIIWVGLLVIQTSLDSVLEILTLLEEIREKIHTTKGEKQNGTDV